MQPEIETDGLDALRSRVGVKAIMSWIEQTARWVHPDTFRFLPVWYPEHVRGALLYKENWTTPLMNVGKVSKVPLHKREGNMYASLALSAALGLKKQDRPNWSCCHIWGVDDEKFQKQNSVVKTYRFYSCIGNMVLLPTPLKAFTDSIPEVKAMLRFCARNLYDWHCDHEDLGTDGPSQEKWDSDYPSTWPRKPNGTLPSGVINFTPSIRANAKKRLEKIWSDLVFAGPRYPRDEVRAAMQYWEDKLQACGEITDRLHWPTIPAGSRGLLRM